MAALLSMLPGLLGAVNSSGVIGKISDIAGNVLKDVAEGHIGSWGDLGKSLAAGGARALGTLPKADAYPADGYEQKYAAANLDLLKNSRNAADHHPMMAPMESDLVKVQMPRALPFTRLGDAGNALANPYMEPTVAGALPASPADHNHDREGDSAVAEAEDRKHRKKKFKKVDLKKRKVKKR